MFCRIVRMTTLVLFAAFCGCGYLASLEMAGMTPLRVAYVGLGAACLVGAVGDSWLQKLGGGKAAAGG